MSIILLLIVVALAAVIAFAIAVWATGRQTLEPAPSTAGFPSGRAVDEGAVAAVRFDTGLRGYRTDQVDEALRHVAWELGRRDEIIAQLESELSDCVRRLEAPVVEEGDVEPSEQEPVSADEVDEDTATGDDDEAAPPRRQRGSVSPLSDSSPDDAPASDEESRG